MKKLIICFLLLTFCSIGWGEEIVWHDLESWIKNDEVLRSKLAFDVIQNKKTIDLEWFLEYERELNEKCSAYKIHCECGQYFSAIPDKRTWREYCMLESWITTCPHCKTKYNAWYDHDFPAGTWEMIEDRFVESKNVYFEFRYKKTKTYCNDKNCKCHYISHIDFGHNSCTPELKKEWIKKNKRMK